MHEAVPKPARTDFMEKLNRVHPRWDKTLPLPFDGGKKRPAYKEAGKLRRPSGQSKKSPLTGNRHRRGHFRAASLMLGRGRIDQRHFAPQYGHHLASTRRARESSLIGTTVGAYSAERMANMCFPSLSVNTT